MGEICGYNRMEGIRIMKIVSLNANGLRNYQKVDAILEKNKDKDIVCLQETNWDKKLIEYVRGKWGGGVYALEGEGKRSDVVVMFGRDLGEERGCTYIDEGGRCIVIDMMV